MIQIIDAIMHKTDIMIFSNSPLFVQKIGCNFITQIFLWIQHIYACWSSLMITLHNWIFLSHFSASICLFYLHLRKKILPNRFHNHKDKDKKMITFVFLFIWFLSHFWSRSTCLFIFSLLKVFFPLSFLEITYLYLHIYINKSIY